MPEKGFILELIDTLTLVCLCISALILLIQRSWKNNVSIYLLANILYSIFTIVLAYKYPMNSKQFGIVSNLTMQVDTISGLGFFYFLWNDKRYRKLLVYSIIPVLIIWIITLFVKPIEKNSYWNQMLPAAWFLFAGIYAMLQLYRKAGVSENDHYFSRFLLIAGFLFYNVIFLMLQSIYFYLQNLSLKADAWNINYWSYFIFRLMMLVAIIIWYAERRPIRVRLPS